MNRYWAMVAGAAGLLAVGAAATHWWHERAAHGHGPSVCPVACSTCALPGGADRGPGGAFRMPPPTGRPVLLVFQTADSGTCRRMSAILDAVRPRLSGKADVVVIDAGRYRQEAVRWRLRRVPTQVLLSPTREEIRRHEGYLTAQELLALVRATVPGRSARERGRQAVTPRVSATGSRRTP